MQTSTVAALTSISKRNVLYKETVRTVRVGVGQHTGYSLSMPSIDVGRLFSCVCS